MPEDRLLPPESGVPVWPAVGVLATTPILVWAALGRHDSGGDFAVGPYHVNLWLEIAVGILAIVVFAGSAVRWWVDRRGGDGRRLSAGSVALGIIVMVSVSAAWRVMTAGVVGANIGAGLTAMFAPFIIAVALVGAVVCQHAFRPMPRPMLVCSLLAAAAAAPALFIAALAMTR